MLSDLYQDNLSGEFYYYSFYELLYKRHCLNDSNGNRVYFTNEEFRVRLSKVSDDAD